VVIYLACAPKSNAAYMAFKRVKAEVESLPSYQVPVHLRNAPTKLMKNLGYGKQYRYDPDEPGGFARGQTYFPEEMGEKQYYFPVDKGLEIKIAEKLRSLKEKET
jgi:putative ATPase